MGWKDSNLRSTDYESHRRPSTEPNLAWQSESCPGSSAEFGGVGDQFRDQVSRGLIGAIRSSHFPRESSSDRALCRLARIRTRDDEGRAAPLTDWTLCDPLPSVCPCSRGHQPLAWSIARRAFGNSGRLVGGQKQGSEVLTLRDVLRSALRHDRGEVGGDCALSLSAISLSLVV